MGIPKTLIAFLRKVATQGATSIELLCEDSLVKEFSTAPEFPAVLDLATEINDAAKEDGERKYSVQAFKDGSRVASYILECAPPRTRDFRDEEKKQESALAKTLMRGFQQMFETTVKSQEKRLQRAEEANELLRKEQRDADKRREELFWKIEEVRNEEAERRAFLMREKRRDEFAGLLTALVPRLLGGLPQSLGLENDRPSATEAMIAKTVANLSEEELVGIMGCLSSHNQMAFAELYKRMREIEKKINPGASDDEAETTKH